VKMILFIYCGSSSSVDLAGTCFPFGITSICSLEHELGREVGESD
jgi:hypothetical protein